MTQPKPEPMPDQWRAHYELERAGGLPMWTAYQPGVGAAHKTMWTARLFRTLPAVQPTDFVLYSDSQNGLVELLPPTVGTFIARHPLDEPEVVGCWL